MFLGSSFGLLVALALVSSVDADRPTTSRRLRQPPAMAPSPQKPKDRQQTAAQKTGDAWTQPRSLQDSLDTLRWVKPKQAHMAEIHRPRPSFLQASIKAAPIEVVVPSVAETSGFVRLVAAQAPAPAEAPNQAEVLDDEPLDLEDLLGDDGEDERLNLPDDEFVLPDDLGDGEQPAEEPGLDQVDPEIDPMVPDMDAEPEPAMDTDLPDIEDGGPPAELPTPGNGTTIPDVVPTPLDDPGSSIELEPLSDEIASMFNGRNCPEEELIFHRAWDELRRRPISSISLDITPSIAPTTPALNIQDPQDPESVRADRMAAAPSRVWRDRLGRVLAEGRMLNFTDAIVRVETASGIEDLSWYALNNEDLCFVSSWWELPSEFSIATNQYVPRDWTLTTFTWTASALSHKPLYFDEVQLERYGHSAGPIKQPILSGVHFFGNIFFLPYKMGLNPPTECQYALGYYRPGSCAPWLLPAVPLSARGARWQLAAVIGALAIFP